MVKAVFGSEDPHPAFGIREAGEDKKYLGVERRRYHRRTGADRRASVRFSAESMEDRRKHVGRREDDQHQDFW